MKSLLKTTTAAFLAGTAMASAGGIQRTDQSVDLLFEDGTVAQFSLAFVMPNVSDDLSGVEMAPDYTMMSGGFKIDYTDSISAAVIFDQPFGALADYTAGPFAGIDAKLVSNSITALVSYDFTDNIVVYGGFSIQETSADATLLPGPVALDVDSGTGFGYVVGAAYQIPEYALRVALTYRSEVESTHATTLNLGAAPDTTFVTPQSVNLELQSGINEKTLVFGSVRWVNWSAIAIEASGGLVPLVDYENDTFNYEIGVGRKLTEDLSAAVTIGYESSDGLLVSSLSPTDGRSSIGAALIYTMGDTEFTGGARYTWLGDAVAAPGVPFSDNTAIAVGLSVMHTF